MILALVGGDVLDIFYYCCGLFCYHYKKRHEKKQVETSAEMGAVRGQVPSALDETAEI